MDEDVSLSSLIWDSEACFNSPSSDFKPSTTLSFSAVTTTRIPTQRLVNSTLASRMGLVDEDSLVVRERETFALDVCRARAGSGRLAAASYVRRCEIYGQVVTMQWYRFVRCGR